MAINKKNLDFLFDITKQFDNQFAELADNCFNEVKRALEEIVENYIENKSAYVVPYGVYAAKDNYQLVEPMEFFVVLPSDMESVLKLEEVQKKKFQKNGKRRTVKDIYESLTTNTVYDEYGNTHNLTAFDAAKTIMLQLQKYLNPEDKVYYKRNVVFMKLHIDDEIDLPVIIYVGYKFENDEQNENIITFSKLGYKMNEDVYQTTMNILEKNKETNGNYLVLCKLFKMLELELVLTEESNVYLSKKSIFMESLLYNIPNKFFENDDFSKIFTDVINYIKHGDCAKFHTIDNPNNQLFTKNGYYSNHYYSSIVKKLVYINQYGNEMIDNALKNANNSENKPENVNKPKNVKKIKKN